MKLKLTTTVCLLLILCSCKSLQLASSRNHPSNANSAKKNNNQFLDNVTIKPGENKDNNYTYNRQSNQSAGKHYGNNSSANPESADPLQIKYSIIMDVPVEQLNDLLLLQQIDHWWGTKYCLGGNDESCIDCSAFTQTILRTVYNINVPRTAQEQYDFSTHISDDEIKEGDLVFFKSGKSISHVGIYIANNKFLNASTSNGVTISDLNDSYWNKRYAGAGRVINTNTSASGR